jgi:eukaryotic-like serine/threonine-protein kinase
MPFNVPIADAQAQFPQFTFVAALTPSEQKAAFHVQQGGQDLCLKMIAPTYDVDRIGREIHAMQLLQHPNVVRLIEYTFSASGNQTKHYILEEFVAGQDLSAHLTGAPWQRPRVSRFFAAMADGLGAMAAQDLVHRDLKPSNVRVRANDDPVIIDFGLARHLRLTDLTSTAQGAGIGTPAYFAPEQFLGTKHDIDHRTDLFAFGVLLYQALVGPHPFFRTGMTYSQLQTEVCQSVAYKQDPAFVALPPQWQLLANKLLSKSRADRPAQAIHVATILRKLGAV